jgi:predicted pyridoxine 5'-phosphate oxidase superfamily flavin-nucleotide-binding protein
VDSLRNTVGNPHAALLFFVPGFEETLKVFGTTTLVGPDDLGVDLTEFGRPPRSVLVLTVEQAYFQCGKAVMRSGLWDAGRQVERSTFPSLGEVLRDHCGLSTPLPGQEEMRAELAQEL